MVAVTIDPGKALFERYLKGVGYDITAYEPDLGTAKRQDHLIRIRSRVHLADLCFLGLMRENLCTTQLRMERLLFAAAARGVCVPLCFGDPSADAVAVRAGQ
jgi:hypothetical protein